MQHRTNRSRVQRNHPRRPRGVTIVVTALITALVLGGGICVGYWLLPYFATGEEGKQAAQPTVEAAETFSLDAGADAEIRLNLRNLSRGLGPAKVVAQEAAPKKKVSLTLDGMLSKQTMQAILEALKRHSMMATFFISGMQATQSPEIVKAIIGEGHAVGNYTLRALPFMESMTQEQLVEDFTCANHMLARSMGRAPTRIKANATEYTNEWLTAARACGLQEAVRSSEVLTYHSFRSAEETQAFVDKLPYQSILSIKLSGKLEGSEFRPKEVVETPAIDKQPGASATGPAATIMPASDERLLTMLEWLLTAIDNTNFSPEVEVLRMQNGGKLAQPLTRLYTVEPSVGYAFYGFRRVDELRGILDALKAENSVGTFFITAQEIRDHPDQLQMLLNAKQAIGIAVFPKPDTAFHALCFELLQARKLLEENGYYPHMLLAPFGTPSDALKEAASALQLQIAHVDFSFARESNRLAQTPQEVITSIYKENTYGLQRGQTVCFRMNFFDRSGLLRELILALRGKRNVYAVQDLYLMWSNTEARYSYPLPKDVILTQVYNKIHRGQLVPTEFMDLVQARYIGNPDINTRAQLPGFSLAQVFKLNKTGRISNEDNAAFLTFDDWGTDVNVTKLLRVLERHGVKATFCVRTQYVPDNPNLLRAIAVAGHEIISHSDTHMPLAMDLKQNWNFTEITEAQAEAIQADLEKSYQTLQSIVGDVRLENGKPALSRLFRPPTMAVGRKGMEAVLDCGFTYIVNGRYTTRDYAATSASRLARELESIRSGDVVILHMSDNSIYTADALDRFLTANEASDKGKKLRFARLSDYLGE